MSWLINLWKKYFGNAHESRTGKVNPPPQDSPLKYGVPEFGKALVIKDHKLVDVEYIPDPDMGGYLNPKVIVMHFTCSYNLKNTVDWFAKEGVDIHLLIDKDGKIVQMVPFNKAAAHAGKSEWKGYSGLNNHSIGIELINIGPLTLKGQKFFDCYGREWKGNVIRKDMLGYKYWEPVTYAQMEATKNVIKTLMKEYQIPASMVCAHHEASPGRKNDVGGTINMSMDDFRRSL